MLDSYDLVLPDAAERSEGYLRAVAKSVTEQSLPVNMGLEDHSAGWMSALRGGKRQFLAVQPEGRKVAGLKMLHFGFPVGNNLACGWLLVGNFGNLDLFEFMDLNAMIGSVHNFAVEPAMYEIAQAVSYSTDNIRKRGTGFFGA